MTPAERQTAPFLFEIGSEEIPARFVPGSMAELARRFAALAAEHRLAAEGVRTFATPRRLVLRVDALALRQPDREVVLQGPPLAIAFDADGEPTRAALGFARKAGVELAACERVEGDRGARLQARRVEPGRATLDVLVEELPGLVTGLPFPKVMRWGNLDLEYARPLQWLLALLGEQVVPARIGPYAAGRITRGHRTLAGDRELAIAHPDAYEDALAAAGVTVAPERRRAAIRDGLAAALAAYDDRARLIEDDELLEEVVHLCEHPTPFVGAFDAEFLELPAAVVRTALREHQRYFGVARRDGDGLVPCFAAVRDGGDDHLEQVVRGNERVLRARLADALFYWRFDQRRSPGERVEQLAAVTWLEGFGSVRDKTERLRELARVAWLSGLGESEPPAALDRAALLCKSDLVSEMIRDGKEFTKLEGFIGARYAERAGEDPAVVAAIEHHYAPRSASGELPPDRISAVLAVADRLDNLAGCWLAGFAPTGTKDPYALRRQTLAVLRILLDRGARVDLAALLAHALAPWRELPQEDFDAARAGLTEFVSRRLEGHFVEVEGRDPDVVRAVLPVRWADPVDARAWIEALAGYRDREDFQQLATGFKRCRNILEGEILPLSELDACRDRWLAGGGGAAGEDLATLPAPEEQELRRRVAAAAAELVRGEDSGSYGAVFDVLSSLGPSIDVFFDEVRVNVEDTDLRARRRAFLREIHGLFARYADFSAVAPVDS